MVFDIVIIGMGPAGATFARLLPQSFKTAVIDRKSLHDEEGTFRKPCGGLLSPDAQKILAKFNLTLPKEILVTPQIFAVKTIDIKSKITTYYQRFYLNMDRHKFDMWLASLIDKEVKIFEKTVCKNIIRDKDLFKITIISGGKEEIIYSKYIVGADGSNSMTRKLFFKKKIRQYVAIQQWFKEKHPVPFYSSIFDETITDCYAWSDSKDGYFILGAALSAKNCRKKFEQLKEKLKDLGYKLSEPVLTECCLVSRPASPFQFAVADKGVFLIGEAAGFISPSSLEGISYAMNSAFQLYKVFTANTKHPEKAYRRRTLKIRFTLILKLIKSIFMYCPPLRRIIIKSGIFSIEMNKNRD
ncbi:MAG: FAD-binding protein [Prevotellaceae bacterium]|jgi:flavin-dependent dehydrogenase|nr:FAD-binding protein [Prevotellaceae bacterium]